MKILFNSGTKISDTDLKDFFPNVNHSMSFALLEPYIKGAARDYIIPYIGIIFYKKLVSSFEENEADEHFKEVLELLKLANAHYAIYDALPHLNTVISDFGVKETSNHDVMPVSLWRFKAARWSAMIKADKYLDLAFQYIEDNIDETYFNDLKEDNEYKEAKSEIFPTTKELKKYISIDGRRAYIALLPYIDDALGVTKKLICGEETIFENETPNDIEKELIHHIKKYTAKLALYKAIPYLNLIFDGNGFKLASSTDAFDSRHNSAEISKLTFEKIRPIIHSDLKESEAELIRYLKMNDDVFTGYAENHKNISITSTIILSDDCIGGMLID